MSLKQFYNAIIVPCVVLQSVAIAGGYGTGREVVEYFTRFGAYEGLYALLTVVILLGSIAAVTFNYARLFRLYDYRTLIKSIIGRYWVLFEVLCICFFLLVLAIIASAAGVMLSDNLGLSESIGTTLMLVGVGVVAYLGRKTLENLMLLWTIIILIVFSIYFYYTVIASDGSESQWASALQNDSVADDSIGWFWAAVKFSLYSSPAIPVILYAARDIKTQTEAVVAGYAAVAASMLPGLMLHLSFIPYAGELIQQAVPTYWIIESVLQKEWLLYVYMIALFGTFLETGAGCIQGFNERLDGAAIERTGRPVSRKVHAVVAVIALLIGTAVSKLGLINLVAHGFGTIAWGFLVVYVIPLFTIGIINLKNGHSPQLAKS